MPVNGFMLQEEALDISKRLDDICQTQARGLNLAVNVICELELARGLYHIFYFKFNFSCVCNVNILLFQIQCSSKTKVCFHMNRLNATRQR